MASIARDPNGYKRIIFKAPNGKRRPIRLGKVSQKTAESVKIKVEALARAAATGSPLDDDVIRWLNERDNEMIDKLVAVGLISPRASATLGAFLQAYLDKRVDVKKGTAVFYRHTKRCLVEYFGTEKPLREITQGDADAWRIWLVIDQKLADNTVRRRCGLAKQFFRAAQRQRIMTDNPFADLKSTVNRNEKRDYFITRDESQKVIDACPDAQWRLLFALSRYAGLRCPSEHLGMRWDDIDWEHGRMVVHSPKTEHHAGGASRVVPIFPELRAYLEDVQELATPGVEYVITRYRETNVNLRTQLQKIIKRAGLSPWPKLFQNLRASRATELADAFPSHVAAAWLGHCEAIANKHYRQVTEEHFKQAAQNPARLDASSDCQSLPVENEDFRNCRNVNGLQQMATTGKLMETCPVGDTGFELSSQSSRKTGVSEEGGAKSGAPGSDDTDLAELVGLWPGLSPETKARIIHTARTSSIEKTVNIG